VPDDLRARLDRLKSQAPPAPPPLAAVERSGRRLRRNRRLATAGTGAVVVAVLVGAGLQLLPDRQPSPPATVNPTLAPVPTPSVTAPVPTLTPRPTRVAGDATTTDSPTVGAGDSATAPTPGYTDFLRPADLDGDGWRLESADPATSSPRQIDVPECESGPSSGPREVVGRSQTFVRPFDADLVLSVSQQVTPLTSARADVLGRTLAASASCIRPDGDGLPQAVVATGEGMLVVASVLPSGQIGSARGYAVTPRAYIELNVAVGYARASAYPVSGQAPAVVGLVRTAVQRLTGTLPHALAVRSQFRAVSQAVPAGPGPRFLQRPDLGARGAWARPYVSPRAGAGPTTVVVTLPACAAGQVPQTLQVTGSNTASQSYAGWSGPGPDAGLDNLWVLDERIVTLSATDAAAARTAIVAAARCLRLRGPAAQGTLSVLPSSPDTVVATSSSSVLTMGQAYALKGTVLVQLSTETVNRRTHSSAGQAAPVAPSWLVELIAVALNRAGG